MTWSGLMRRPRLLWAALAGWAAVILRLSSMTPRQLPHAAFVFSDKFNHFVAYAVGGWLAACALRASRPSAAPANNLVKAVLLIAAFGAADEMFQTFTPGRSGADLDDWLADVAGAIAGALLMERLPRGQR